MLAALPSLGQPMPPSETDSRVGITNRFIFQGTETRPLHFKAKEATLRALLLTPVNSSFNHTGDLVQAQIISPPEGDLGRLLPAGTVLFGLIDRARPAARFQQNGKIMLLFYGARVGKVNFQLDWITDSENRELPLPIVEKTNRQKLRVVLMTANRLAVPAAFGSGGLSLAITTGTGALIGGALADNKHYLSGAARGAWEGAGLTVLDPLLQKGTEAIFPVGTTLELKLSHPVDLTVPTFIANRLQLFEQTNTSLGVSRARSSEDKSREYLITWARILPRSGLPTQRLVTFAQVESNDSAETNASNAQLQEVTRCLNRKDLAGAIAAAEQAFKLHPNNSQVAKVRAELLQMILAPPNTAPLAP